MSDSSKKTGAVDEIKVPVQKERVPPATKVWDIISSHSGLSKFETAMEQSRKKREDFLKAHPDGCSICLGSGAVSETSERILGKTFKLRNYCKCQAGIELRASDDSNNGERERYLDMVRRRSAKSELQTVYDKISSELSTAFCEKYFVDEKPTVTIGMKYHPTDTEDSRYTKGLFESAMYLLSTNAMKYLTGKGLNMYVYWSSGIGKSHQTVATFHVIRETLPDVTAMYITFDDYLDFLKEGFDKKGWGKEQNVSSARFAKLYANPKISSKVEQHLYTCDVLFIDEVFGNIDKTSTYYLAKLKALLDRRISGRKITVFVSNKSMGEAQNMLASTTNANKDEEIRIFNRLREVNTICDPRNQHHPEKYGIHVVGKALNAPTELDDDFLAAIAGLRKTHETPAPAREQDKSTTDKKGNSFSALRTSRNNSNPG